MCQKLRFERALRTSLSHAHNGAKWMSCNDIVCVGMYSTSMSDAAVYDDML